MAINDELDDKLLRIMFNSIRKAEAENTRTQKKDDKSMVKTIEEYVVRKIREESRSNED